MTPAMTEKDWSELKRLLDAYADRRDALEEIQLKQDEARSHEIQFKAALLRAESEGDRQGNKNGIAEVRKQQNLLFDHECLVRADLLCTAKEMDFLLNKCFTYGLMTAFEGEPFVRAVEMTIEAIYDTCGHNPFELAKSRGAISTGLAQRYYKFLNTYSKDKFKRDSAIRDFAELQGMPMRSAKERLDQAIMHGAKLGVSLNIMDAFEQGLIEQHGLSEKQLAKIIEQAKMDIHLEAQTKEWAEAACNRMKRRENNQAVEERNLEG